MKFGKILKVSGKENIIYSLGKKINQIDPLTNKVIKVWNTVTEIYTHFNKKVNGNVTGCCNGTRNTYKDFKWSYA